MLVSFFIGMGFFFIVIGLLVYKYHLYGMMLGYNRLLENQKRNIEADKIKKIIVISFLMMALMFFIGALLVNFGYDSLAILIVLLVFAFIFPYVLIKIRQYDYNEENSITAEKSKRTLIITILVVIIFFLIFVIAIVLSAWPATITPERNYLIIDGVYGEEIAYDEIKEVAFRNYIPDIKSRIEGFNAIIFFKGIFEIDDMGECQLYITKGNSAYIYLKTEDRIIIINKVKTEETKRLFEEIFTRWKGRR